MAVINGRFEKSEKTIHSLVSGQQIILEETRDIKRRVTHIEYTMEDMQESLSFLTKAEGKDAEATINHEERLRRLERINKIKSVSPEHLIGNLE